jgi:hypothetical protein
VNTLRIAEELGIRSRFRPVHRIHQVARGQFPSLQTLDNPTSLFAAAHNALHHGLLPWSVAVPLYRAILELAATEAPDLDSMSVAEFVASRPYGSPAVAEALDTLLPKLIGARAGQLSAFVWQEVVRLWLRYRRPVFHMLDGNLQERLIEPFEGELRGLGCTIACGARVERLDLQDDEVVRCRYTLDGQRREAPGSAFVLATPFDEAARLLDAGSSRFAKVSTSLQRLQTVPMGTLTLHLRTRLRGLPPEHVMLAGSPYALGFVDVSQTWAGLDGSALHFNIGNLEPLRHLPSDRQIEAVLREVCDYLPVRQHQIAHVHLRTNFDMPLFLNAVGAWSHQPAAGAVAGARNLYLCGEYCRSPVRIVSVEATIVSALSAAAALLARSGDGHQVRIDLPQRPSEGAVAALRGLMIIPASLVAARRYIGAESS